MTVIKKLASYGSRKITAFIIWLISLALHYPSIFFCFYLIFILKRKTPFYESVPMFILLGILSFIIYAFHRLLKKWVKRITTPIKGGIVRGLKRSELIIFVTLAFYFTTKAYPNEKILLYFVSVIGCFIASALLEGISLKIINVDTWDD
jgi:hypothetical protein